MKSASKKGAVSPRQRTVNGNDGKTERVGLLNTLPAYSPDLVWMQKNGKNVSRLAAACYAKHSFVSEFFPHFIINNKSTHLLIDGKDHKDFHRSLMCLRRHPFVSSTSIFQSGVALLRTQHESKCTHTCVRTLLCTSGLSRDSLAVPLQLARKSKFKANRFQFTFRSGDLHTHTHTHVPQWQTETSAPPPPLPPEQRRLLLVSSNAARRLL